MKPEHVIIAMDYFSAAGMKNIPKLPTDEDLQTMAELWSELLEHVPGDIFIKACKTIMANQIFFPSLAEVREKCEQYLEGYGNSGHAVFDSLKKEMFRVSHTYVQPEEKQRVMDSITDPVAKKAAENFDWRACGIDSETKLGIHKAHFVKLYEHYSKESKFEKDSQRISPGVHTQLKNIIHDVTKTIQ